MDRVRRLVVGIVVLVVASLVILVVTVRPGLRDTADRVDKSWTPLVAPLNVRYHSLAGLRDALNVAGLGQRTVTTQLTKTLTQWSGAATGTDADEQVTIANRLEALAARTRALVRTPRLLENAALATAFTNFTKTEPQKALLDAYNHKVLAYQGDRDGFWSRIVARLDGYDMRPTLQLVSVVSHALPTLAILGGGQLGRMLGLSAVPLGVTVRSLDPVEGAPAGALGDLVVGPLDDLDALRATIAGADVVTFEWEGVPAGPLRTLVADGAVLRPPAGALEVSQDRIDEKTTFRALGIPVAEFAPVDDAADLRAAIDAVGTPAILKTRRGGYDGKGQTTIATPADARAAWENLRAGGPLILERRVAFDRELSIIAVRGVDGEIGTWPLVENEHRDGILRTSHAPALDLDAALQARADGHVRAVLEHFDYVGVLTLELFQVGDDVLANEMAPRVHNSGHWTIEGARTSQFENHVRAVLGWPLGPTDAPGPSVMINCIGALPEPTAVLAVPGAHLHRYGKAPRPGRKVGHVTITADDRDELDRRVRDVRSVMPPDVG